MAFSGRSITLKSTSLLSWFQLIMSTPLTITPSISTSNSRIALLPCVTSRT